MHLFVPHVSPVVVHLCLNVLSYYCALVEVVAFGVEVLLAVWAFELFVGFIWASFISYARPSRERTIKQAIATKLNLCDEAEQLKQTGQRNLFKILQ